MSTYAIDWSKVVTEADHNRAAKAYQITGSDYKSFLHIKDLLVTHENGCCNQNSAHEMGKYTNAKECDCRND